MQYAKIRNTVLLKPVASYRLFLIFMLLFFLFKATTVSQDLPTLELESEIEISPLLGEISGMAFYEDDIYAINDSGNGPYIFQLDILTGRTRKIFKLQNIRNKDWEELSVSGKHLYIGDFGNNRGKRKDLLIYRLHIDSLEYPAVPVLSTGMEYAARSHLSGNSRYHEWDCEAMTVSPGGIFCFSKDRKNLITKLYRLREGEYNNLVPVDSFNTGFLVTGAYYDNAGDNLYLCGYYKRETYLLHFRNDGRPGFSGDHVKYIIPELKNTQVESIFVRGNFIYLGSERTVREQAIYRIALTSLNDI